MKRFCALAVVAAACTPRTQLVPVRKPVAQEVYVGEKRCDVYDYVHATDLPDGAQNLGWVVVERAETDEETYLELRKKICELGGDALSQLAWLTDPGQPEPTKLKANAWSLP
ncbi:MAG: hypothetical protein ACOZIN_06035 [Myxococcota bacterium]